MAGKGSKKNSEQPIPQGTACFHPRAASREHARKLGVQPGGDVTIHGFGAEWGWIGSQHRLKDWTDGCIAVTNDEEIFPLVRTGTVVEIRP